MSSPDHNSKSMRPEQEPNMSMTGVFIDDDPGCAEGYAQLYSTNNNGDLLIGFKPILIDVGSYSELKESLEAIPIQSVRLIVADQFYEFPALRAPVSHLIEKVRQANPETFVLETSGNVTSGGVYPGSDRVLGLHDFLDVMKIMGKGPLTNAQTRLEILREISLEPFLESIKAESLDPSKIHDREKLDMSLNRAMRYATYPDILTLLGISQNEFELRQENIPIEQSGLYLHLL